MVALIAAALGASLGVLLMGMLAVPGKDRAYEDGLRAGLSQINRPRTADTVEGMDMKE